MKYLRFGIFLATTSAWIVSMFLMPVHATGQSMRTIDSSQNERISHAQLQQDFRVLRKSLEESHSGLYRYTSKEGIDAAFDKAMAMIDRDMTVVEFYAIVTTLSDAIKCGHTQFVLPAEVKKSLQEMAKQFPVRLEFLSGKAYVSASSDNQITPGSELRSINNVPISAITDAIMRHLPGDGDIETGKYRGLSAAFGWLYFLYVGQPDFFTIEYLDAAGNVHQAKLRALTAKEMQQQLKDSTPGQNSDAAWKYELLPLPHSARLTVKTFAPPDESGGLQFTKFLDASFKVAMETKIEDLIVDLRGNDGGEDYGPALYSYIADRDFEVYSSVESRTNKLSFISQYSNLGPDFLTKFQKELIPVNGGRFQASSESGFSLPTQHPRPNNYRNRVWVLIDGEVFSSGTVFCSLAKSHKRASFIGEETGGAYQGFNAGELVVITLPSSKLRAVIPLLSFKIATGQIEEPRRGILPDYAMRTSVKEVIDNKDSELDFVLNLIQQKRSRPLNNS